ncbi:MAG: TIGR02266 family protein [candidate division NC10 bacterium]|nr:TIGR02266 family protein [candidate division NC10 bacterium]
MSAWGPAVSGRAGTPGRRRFPRFELYLPTVIWSWGRELPGKAKDLGEGGLKLLLAEGLPVGTGGTLRLEGGTETVHATARVVWLGSPEVSDLGARLVPHGLVFPTPLRRGTVEALVTAQIRLGTILARPRASVRLPVEYQITAPAIAAYCLNISEGGMFIRTPDPAPPNKQILVRFRLPHLDREFRVRGRVVWSNPTPVANPFPPGMGVQFLGLEEKTSRLLGDYVERLLARRGGDAEVLPPWFADPEEPGKGR